MTHAGMAYWPLVLSWALMSAAMLPATWPWLRVLSDLSRKEDGAPSGLPGSLAPSFAAGYLSVWVAFGFAAAALQLFWLQPTLSGGALRGGVLAAAGLYQLSPIKSTCLTHCRSPMSVVLSRWPVRTRGALALGVEHGIFCVGCCLALMLVAVCAGGVGWGWMAALVALVTVEKLSAVGPHLARATGAALVVLALAEWAWA